MKKYLSISLVLFLALFLASPMRAQQGPVKTSQVNATYYVGAVNGFYPSIQSAVTKACSVTGGGRVVIPTGSSPSDTIAAVTTGCTAVSLSDERAGLPSATYNWGGASFTWVPTSGAPYTASFLPVFVQGSTLASSTVPALTISTTLATTKAGDTLLALTYSSGTTGSGCSGVSGVTDSQGNTYTQITVSGTQYVFGASGIRGGADTITSTFSGCTPVASIRVEEYANVAAVSPVDATVGYGFTGTGTTSITTTKPNDMVVAVTYNATAAAITGFSSARATNNPAINDYVDPTAGALTITYTGTTGACCSGTSISLLVALINGVPPVAASPLPTWITVFQGGVQGTSNQVYMAIPVLSNLAVPSGCTGSYASAQTAATGTTAFTLVKRAGGLAGTSTTLCTATWSAAGTVATLTGSGGYPAPGDYLEILGAATADSTLANVALGFYGTH
jgi:hypothetical protein